VLFSEPKIPQCCTTTSAVGACCVSVLFSEPKIPQFACRRRVFGFPRPFQCSSASRKFLNLHRSPHKRATRAQFQCSSASRKFLNPLLLPPTAVICPVSVLFSEPKIPQSVVLPAVFAYFTCFSALQRAENSSIPPNETGIVVKLEFQCSSASRKFLNPARVPTRRPPRPFQCSSASRKFLNSTASRAPAQTPHAFQCSSASRKFLNFYRGHLLEVNIQFQCSSASRKFLNQSTSPSARGSACFSALQRAENSSIGRGALAPALGVAFQCSSASRKFLNAVDDYLCFNTNRMFQCSSASRKFLNRTRGPEYDGEFMFQCSSASRKFLNPAPASRRRMYQTGFSALQRAENSSIGLHRLGGCDR